MTSEEENEIKIMTEHMSKIVNKLINIFVFMWVAMGVAKFLFLAGIAMLLYYVIIGVLN